MAGVDVGLGGDEAALDIRDMRSLLDCIRLVRSTAMQTAVRMITTAVMLALLAGIAIKLKIFGGGPYAIPPQADCGWIGEAGPGPSYGDDGAGFDNEFTQRNTTIMTWNQMHMARMLRDAGGIPNHGNDRNAWSAGCRFDFENPEHRS